MESDRRRDRLSELHDSLILEILSRLKTRVAVQTTILSKRWKDLWTTVPRLHFWCENSNFIAGVLAKWNGEKIEQFALTFSEDDIPAANILDSWLHIPIDKQVEQFSLDLQPDHGYSVPQRLYSCSSITKLSLACSNLKIDENVNVQLNQLKSLTVEDVFYFRGNAINRILCGAPLLEELILLSCEMNENLNIRSTSLKKLRISGDISLKSVVMPGTTLTIWAPNLLSLDISAGIYGTCSLHVPSLIDAVICFEVSDAVDEPPPPPEMFDQLFRSLRRVEKLTLSDLSIQILLQVKEHPTFPLFSNAKFLKLSVDSAEAEVLLDNLGMFPKLMNLVIQRYEDYTTIHREPQVPSLSLLQLKTVDITWSKVPTSIFPMVKLMLKNAPVLEKMVLQLRAGGYVSEEIDLAKTVIMSMPRSSPIAQVIIRRYG